MVTTRLSQSCSIPEWRRAIAACVGIAEDSFQLQTRSCVIEMKNTIRSYGVSPETVVYLTKCCCVCGTREGERLDAPFHLAERIPFRIPFFSVCHQSESEEMNEMYSTQQAEDNDYLPQNDEFIPPTNFAVIEKGLYRSTLRFLVDIERCLPRKTELPVFEASGNPFHSVWTCNCVRVMFVESSFQKIILKTVSSL